MITNNLKRYSGRGSASPECNSHQLPNFCMAVCAPKSRCHDEAGKRQEKQHRDAVIGDRMKALSTAWRNACRHRYFPIPCMLSPAFSLPKSHMKEEVNFTNAHPDYRDLSPLYALSIPNSSSDCQKPDSECKVGPLARCQDLAPLAHIV
jgi:hypothetical protein